jgi:predicted GH43/DUF377 family glycosyl hydrolase
MAPARELLTRHPSNPILTWRDVPVPANAIYNPGAARVGEKYLLLPRVEYPSRDNDLHCAWSEDGIHFTVEPRAIALDVPDHEKPLEHHRYDARITRIGDEFFIAYCAQDFGETVRIALARTRDFRSFERHGFITEPWSRNCALFPEKINGLHARLDRPMSGNEAITFVSYSPDLIHWGQSRPVEIHPATWLRNRWGIGPTPIRTDAGWLLIIHGVWIAIAPIYRLGVMLLDLEEPWRVIGQCPNAILTPTEPYERIGEVNNCVFSNGAIVEPDGTVKVYYGAADTCIGLATAKLEELIEACV